MRQRKAKNLAERLKSFEYDVPAVPEEQKGRWQQLFDREQPLYLELGCGKGQFIVEMARRHPDRNYIAVEGQATVILRALEKASGLDTSGLDTSGPDRPDSDDCRQDPDADKIFDQVYRGGGNVVFVNCFMRGIDKYFEKGELSGIFLNFSDPWPKEKHAKRRLTHRGFLDSYRRILEPGSEIQFKTDNDSLFEFSVEEFRARNFEIPELTRNLHGEPRGYESAEVPTEYESRFMARGKNINYLKAIC